MILYICYYRNLYIMENRPRGLYRSINQQVIGGVAAGIADHLNTDPTIIRILFVVLALFGGGGVLIYLILWIALPPGETPLFNQPNNFKSMENEKNQQNPNPQFDPNKNWNHPKNDGSLIAGIILITLGLIFLADRFLPRIDFGDLWPIILLVAGIVMIKSGYSKSKNS